MKRIKLISLIAISIVMMLLLCACSLSSKGTIVGKWESDEENGIFYSNIEFFSDGTHVTDAVGWCGTYTVDKNRLRLSGKLHSTVFSFELNNNGNSLILTNDLGYSIIYNRVH